MDSRIIPNWVSLPEGIIELVINKLHFVDQIHALVVCKTWRACEKHVKSRDRIPWVMNHERIAESDCEFDTDETKPYVFGCELFDPYTRKVHRVANWVEIYAEDLSVMNVTAFCSKNGWVLLGDTWTTLYLHNPFNNKVITLPLDIYAEQTLATMKASPTSHECEIFMVYVNDEDELGIESIRLSELKYGEDDGNQSRCLIDFDAGIEIYNVINSVLYMKGNIYVLCWEGSMYSYGLEDGSWKLLTSRFPEPCNSWFPSRMKSWLMEINDELMAVFMEGGDGERYNWMVLRFDLSEMSWIVETSLKNCAIYISDNVAFSAPLAHHDKNNLEGCKLFYCKRKNRVAGGRGFTSFILTEAEKARKVKPKEYGWIVRSKPCDMSFIEPPYLGI